MWPRLIFLLGISNSQEILRRYFVVNGFDGALTMLGLIIGFLVSPPVPLSTVTGVCLSAAIALGVSGCSSAYISETAERTRALNELEKAMIKDLEGSSHGQAVYWVPILTAIVNGAAPILISLLIILPLWVAQLGVSLPISPLMASVFVAFVLVYLLGVYLGHVAGVSYIRSGIQTLFVAVFTTGLIYMIAH